MQLSLGPNVTWWCDVRAIYICVHTSIYVVIVSLCMVYWLGFVRCSQIFHFQSIMGQFMTSMWLCPYYYLSLLIRFRSFLVHVYFILFQFVQCSYPVYMNDTICRLHLVCFFECDVFSAYGRKCENFNSLKPEYFHWHTILFCCLL